MLEVTNCMCKNMYPSAFLRNNCSICTPGVQKKAPKKTLHMFPTILILDVWPGSTSEQFLSTMLLAAVGGRVERSVSQQVRAVDVWRLFSAELP